MLRRTIYPAALIATGALLDELAFWLLARRPWHVTDRCVRGLEWLRM